MAPVFVDTSAWFAMGSNADASHRRADELLNIHADRLATTDYVLVETWALARSRSGRHAADSLVSNIVEGRLAEVLPATAQDIDTALRIGREFSDQDFSLVDRTSWVVMERHGIDEAIAFDADFAIYRYGADRRQAFTIHR
ncbi:MAG: PIN domain-containing protein [Acidimicrobiaceae bacterium]|nr:PIN domain-containing protein [Acidimicrobiaceae bacterium]MDE0497726.1 PIN domain-containing protein [Acidimicrobiaceae bacterium]